MGARISTMGGRFDLNQNAEINVTPFVDVMLVLLIIFMVAAPIATASLKVDLPTASLAETREQRRPVFIDVATGGRLFIQGRATSQAALITDLGAAVGTSDPTAERVMVRGDRDIPYKYFMRVMNLLQEGGYGRVGLVAEQEPR